MIATQRQPDMTLMQEGDWWYRAGLHDSDFHTVRTAFTDDRYHLTDTLPRRKNEVIVDVGACVGAFTRLAHLRNRTARIFAIEANPKNIAVLEANASSIATVIGAAVTYESGVGLLDSIYEGTTASGGSVVKITDEVRGYAGDQYLPIADPLPTLTLESLVEGHEIDYIDVLKLDCEGSEHSILRGTSLLDRIGVIVGEYHGGRTAWSELVHDRFPSDLWHHMAWNAHGHMGNFLLVNRASAI